MDNITLVLGSRGSTSGRKLHFVTQPSDGQILIRTLDGEPVSDRRQRDMIISVGGVDSLLAKCFRFAGTEAEFLALPMDKRGICWKTINKKWVDWMIANHPGGIQVGFVVDGLHSQAIAEGKRKNG